MWIGALSKTTPVQIIGSGISGLLVGYFLKKAEIPFEIWEIENKTGGKIQTFSTQHGLVETSANAIILDEYGIKLFQDLKLTPLFAKPKLIRWLFVKNKWLSHWSILFKLLINLILKGFKNAPYLVNSAPNSLESFFTPLMGYSWSHYNLSAISRGIFAKNSFELTIDSFFNINFLNSCNKKKLNYFQFIYLFIKFKKKIKSFGSVSFLSGMQELTDALTLEVKEHLKLNTPIEIIQQIAKKENVLFCTTPHQVTPILESLNPNLANKFKEIPMTSVQSLTLFSMKPLKNLINSFGVLFSPESTFKFYGVLAQSEIFLKNRIKNENTFSYTLIGPIIDQEEVLESFCDFSQINRQDILYFQSHKWHNAIPIYNQKRFELIKEIRQLIPNKNLAFFGNYIEAIGLKDLIKGAQNLVQEIQKS